MGPTASGKSDLAEAVRRSWGPGPLVVADAFQVYRGFDVGTGKRTGGGRELVDFKDPRDDYGAGEFVRLALPILSAAYDAGRDVVVEGGTGFYVRALLEGYDALAPAPDPALRARLMEEESELGLAALVARLPAEIAARTDLRNPVRVRRALERLAGPPPEPFALPPFRVAKIALDRGDLKARIAARVDAMFGAGWPDEVRGLLDSGVPESASAFRAIGYRTVAALLRGETSESAARESVTLETHRYAKRQRTWLRSEPRLVPIGVDEDAPTRVESLFVPGR